MAGHQERRYAPGVAACGGAGHHRAAERRGNIRSGLRRRAAVARRGHARHLQGTGAERATPHDLRRTHGTRVTELGFGRDAMNRIQNHREGGIASVYDRHEYAEENRHVMEATAKRIVSLAEGTATDNVVRA